MRVKVSYLWLFAFIAAIGVFFIAPRGVSEQLPLYMALSAFAVILWVFEIFPPPATAAGLTFAYILLLGMDPELVFAPWSTSLIWIGFGGMLFGEAMKGTGLARRIALRCLLFVGGSFTGLVVGFAIAGVILGLLLPSIFARVVIFCAIGIGIIDTLSLDKKSRMSSTIILMAFFAASAPCMMFLHTSESFIWAFEVMFGKGNSPVTFWDYVTHGTLISLLYVVVSFAVIYLVKGKEKLPPREELRHAVETAYHDMGRITGSELRLLVLVLVGISAFMLQPWTGLDAVYVFAFVSLLCYLPPLRIEPPENFGKLQIVFLIMMTGCIAMGMVGTAVGANAWAVSKITPFLASLSPTMGVISAYIAGALVNFVLTPLAATAAFAPAFGELGVQMSINPLPLFYAFSYGLDQYVLPYEMVPFLYIFTTGYINLGHVVKALALRALLAGIIIAAFAVPYWIFIGIL